MLIKYIYIFDDFNMIIWTISCIGSFCLLKFTFIKRNLRYVQGLYKWVDVKTIN